MTPAQLHTLARAAHAEAGGLLQVMREQDCLCDRDGCAALLRSTRALAAAAQELDNQSRGVPPAKTGD